MEKLIIFLPLVAAIASGFFGKLIGNKASQIITSLFVSLSALLSIYIFYDVVFNNYSNNIIIAKWITSGLLDVNWSIKIDQLSEKAKKYNFESLAITDSANLFGFLKFYKSVREHGIKPIAGAEINHVKDNSSHNEHANLTLIAKNLLGYKNLIKLISLELLGAIFVFDSGEVSFIKLVSF